MDAPTSVGRTLRKSEIVCVETDGGSLEESGTRAFAGGWPVIGRDGRALIRCWAGPVGGGREP